MGKRGPKPGSGGRPKKPLADKILEGNPGKRKLEVVDLPQIEHGEASSYLTDKQKSGFDFEAKEIYDKTVEWLKQCNCDNLIEQSYIERYSIVFARFIQCERNISIKGFTEMNLATGAMAASPYVKMSQDYLKQANAMWNDIYKIVAENSLKSVDEKEYKDDMSNILNMSLKRG